MTILHHRENEDYWIIHRVDAKRVQHRAFADEFFALTLAPPLRYASGATVSLKGEGKFSKLLRNAYRVRFDDTAVKILGQRNTL